MNNNPSGISDDINFEDSVYDSDFKMRFPRSPEQGIELVHSEYKLVMKLKDDKSEYNEVAGSMKRWISYYNRRTYS